MCELFAYSLNEVEGAVVDLVSSEKHGERIVAAAETECLVKTLAVFNFGEGTVVGVDVGNFEYNHGAVALDGAYELAFGSSCDSALDAALGEANANGHYAGDSHVAFHLFGLHHVGIAGNVVSLSGVVGHELIGFLAVAGLCAELVRNSGAGPGQYI